MDKLTVNLQRYFYEEPNGPENDTVVSIRNINKPTIFCFPDLHNNALPCNILFEDVDKDLLRERIRHLLRVASENKYIHTVEIRAYSFLIPAELLAEWIDCNKFVTKLYLVYASNPSNIQLLCDALRRDTIIKTFEFQESNLKEPELQLLGKAICENKGISHIKYCNGNSLTLLQEALRPGTSIKSLTFHCMGYRGLYKDYANGIGKMLSENTSLTTLKIERPRDYCNNIVPILQGVVRSAITDFTLNTSDRICEVFQPERIEIIANMYKIKFLSLGIGDFSAISTERISSILQGMDSLNWLEFRATDNSDYDKLKGIIQAMSTWQRQCKLNLICQDPKADLVLLLHSVQLIKLDCSHVTDIEFRNKLKDEISTWMYLEDLKIQFHLFHDYDNNLWGPAFISAIKKTISLTEVSIRTTAHTNYIIVSQPVVDEVLARNKVLSESKNHPQKVPRRKWPELFELAEPIGLDFSYACIRNMPNLFVNIFRAGFEDDKTSSGFCLMGLQGKRAISSSEQITTAKRIRLSQPI